MNPASRATPPSRRNRRRDELRSQLLDSVGRLLEAGTPYASVTVDALVAEAGVSRSSFYTYFEDKSDLLFGRFLEVADAVHVAAERWWALDAGVDRPALREALSDLFDAYRPHARVMIAVNDLATTTPRFAESVVAEIDRSIDGLAAHIARGQRDGFVDAQLPPRETAAWLWMSEPGFLQIVRSTGTAATARRDAIDCFTGIAWNTLYRPARP